MKENPNAKKSPFLTFIVLRFDALATGQQPVPYDAAEAERVMAETGLAGIYKGFSPAASSPGLDWTLFLSPDNSATLQSDYLNGEPSIVETGVWTAAGTSLEVMLDGAESPMTFEVTESTLASNEISIFGQVPLRLYRFEVVAGSVD